MDLPEQDMVQKKEDFKKPILIGKVGCLPHKISGNIKTEKPPQHSKDVVKEVPEHELEISEPKEILKDDAVKPNVVKKIPYTEPKWSGLPNGELKEYALEVLKSGAIIDKINLMKQPFWVFGRLDTCDICMAHPTISRFHAVLQYKIENAEDQPIGFYLYDLDSTHGTFLNKYKVKPRTYTRVQVGHIIKLGCSSRSYIITGPVEDEVEESALSITELKILRHEELVKRELAKKEELRRIEEEKEKKRIAEEERGVDWGMGEDADEKTDLTENPFAQTNNEDLYIDDPKKTLRGFMEREGLDLEYDCTEQGMSQFLCKVVLPIDDDNGRPIVAEAIHKGKKKEAVVQCALEACRILDRFGLLRQAVHESRKRKVKNWEENDFYDSDDDTFLDRTGTVERKRENRMKHKVPQKAETYESLLEKEGKINEEILQIESEISKSSSRVNKSEGKGDSLDMYMKELKRPQLDKQKLLLLKTKLQKLKADHRNVVKLINIAKPANLPPLISQHSSDHQGLNKKSAFPIFGKRLKTKVQIVNKPVPVIEDNLETEEEETRQVENISTNVNEISDAFANLRNDFLEAINYHIVPNKNALKIIWNKLEKIFTTRDIKLEELIIGLKDLIKFLSDFSNDQDINFSLTKNPHIINTTKQHSILKQLTDVDAKLYKIILDFKKSKLQGSSKMEEDDEEEEEESSIAEIERKHKRNQRRIQVRQEKNKAEKQQGYEDDATKEDYNMWVPPENQTGDGRTSLNDKLGY